MISKKVLGPALTGTGAVGASGTLAWTLGLLDEEILDDVVVEERDVVKPEPEQQKNAPSGPEASAKPAEAAEKTTKESRKDVSPGEAQVGQKAQTGAGHGSMGVGGARKAGTSTWRRFFNDGGGASEFDRKAVEKSSTLEIKRNIESLWINVEKEGDNDFSWKCQLKAIPIEDEIDSSSYQDFSEFERQKKQLEEAIKKEKNKKQLVANCSRSMTNEEKQNGNNGLIELETERLNWNKYKFKEKEEYFQRLWTEDFTGIDKLSKDDEKLVEITNGWNIEETKDGGGRTGKVKITLQNKNWSCYISGDYGGDLKTKTFKKEGLEKILKLNKSDKSKAEKKKYILRNCAKNKKDIKGLTIQTTGRNEWEFSNLEKITDGMYENPKTT